MKKQREGYASGSVLAEILWHLDDDAFFNLVDEKIKNPEIAAQLIREGQDRSVFETDVLEEQLNSFLLQSLQQLHETYMGLSGMSSTDSAANKEIFVNTLRQYCTTLSTPELSEPDWPWPVTEIPGNSKESKTGGDIDFSYDRSGLHICGYRTGKTKGLSPSERKKLLDYFLRNNLPPQVAQVHGPAYGEPGSEKRLEKMATVIAANCRNFKKRKGPQDYRHAIHDYETDLAYLKQEYYKAGSFPWPPIGS